MALYANDIADIEQFFEDSIVKIFVLVWADFVAVHIDLNTSARVLQIGKGGFFP